MKDFVFALWIDFADQVALRNENARIAAVLPKRLISPRAVMWRMSLT
jgi:hypothetical protein